MKNSWISQLLIILVALQSVVAVAGIHLDHPDLNLFSEHEQSAYSQSQHETLDDFSSLALSELALTDAQSTSDTSSAVDCQHCCHCHSPQFNFLGSLFTDPVITDREKHPLDLRSSAPSSLASQLFKPPRA